MLFLYIFSVVRFKVSISNTMFFVKAGNSYDYYYIIIFVKVFRACLQTLSIINVIPHVFSGNPVLKLKRFWIPAFAGMTN